MEKRVFKILAICALLYLLIGEIILPEERKRIDYSYQPIKEGWEWVHEDGTTESVTIPGEYDVQRNSIMTIQNSLPDNLENNTYLLFYSLRQDMRIFIDDELREEYSTENTRLFGRTSSAYYIFLEVSAADAGKTIRIELKSDSDYSGILRDVYYGDQTGLLMKLFKENGPELVVAVLLLAMAVVSLVGSIALRLVYHQVVELEYLSWCICMMAVWMILNSVFRQFLFPNLTIASDVTFMMVMLLPLPFLIYLNELQKKRFKMAYYTMETLVMINIVCCMVLEVLNIRDFADTITIIIGACVVSILLIFITVMIDVYQGNIHEYVFPAVGMLGACLAACVQFVLYVNKMESAISGAIVAFGMTFLLIVSAVSTVRDLVHMSEEKQLAIQTGNAKAQFLASMSHEIRTPINAVLGMDEMILRESNQQEVLEYATDIQNAGKSLLSIINDILDFSKVESGKMEILPVEYSLPELIRDSYNMVAMRAREKKLAFIIKNNPVLPTKYLGDEMRIRQILVNFLTNAVKYSEEGTVTLIVDGHQTEEENVWMLKLSVKDTGIGVKEADLPYLFSAFTRVDEKKNRNIEGTGLGLALSKNLTELMHGEIAVESEYGKGSTFSVSLPQQVVDKKPMGEFHVGDAANRIAKPKKSILYAPEGRILVVDDVAVNLKVFTSLLKKSGLTIDTAESGEECLKLIQEHVYDLIFLDHMMPKMDGMETLVEMKKLENNRNAKTPVIMLTANAIQGVKEQYLSAGFSDYLSKPVQMETLEEMILSYLPKEKRSARSEQ